MPIDLEESRINVDGARVLVTGGAGFIGSHLVDALIEWGARRVVVIDDLSRARPRWYEERRGCERIEFVIENILERNGLGGWFEDVEVVYHLAAVAQVMQAARHPEYTFSVNVLGTTRVAQMACKAGAARFVFASSREVYGDPGALPISEDAPLSPKNVYGASKVAAETYLRTIDPRATAITILRLANVYGLGDRGRVVPIFITNALSGRPLRIYGNDKILDLIWIGDVVDVLLQAGFGPTEVSEPVNVGSGCAVGLQDLANKIKEITNSPSAIEICAARELEVDRFQADLCRAGQYFGSVINDEPLARLPELVQP